MVNYIPRKWRAKIITKGVSRDYSGTGRFGGARLVELVCFQAWLGTTQSLKHLSQSHDVSGQGRARREYGVWCPIRTGVRMRGGLLYKARIKVTVKSRVTGGRLGRGRVIVTYFLTYPTENKGRQSSQDA